LVSCFTAAFQFFNHQLGKYFNCVSILAAVAIAILAVNVRLRRGINLSFMLKFLFSVTIAFFLIFFLDLTQFGIGHESPFSYFASSFAGKGLNLLSSTSNLFFGNSLSLRTATTEADTLGVIDVSWFVLFEKMGIIGMIMGLTFTVKYLSKFMTVSVPNIFNELFLIGGVMLFSLLSYSHTSPMITRPFDYLFMLSTASLFVISRPKILARQNMDILVTRR
jgi:hypothetical protein